MTSEAFAALDETAHAQLRLLTRAQVLQAGHSDMLIYRRIRSGRWQRVLSGVYCIDGGPLTVEQRRVAGALYAGPDAQLTGQSALAWHGFCTLPATDEVHLLVPHETRCRSNGFAVVKRSMALDGNARRAALYRLTSPARAVVDACRELRELRTVRAVVAEAVQRFRVPPRVLDEEVRRAARSRTALVRRALAEIAGGARSAPEAQARAVLEASPQLRGRVLWNPRLALADGTALPTPDGYLPDVGLAIEVDSREFHLSPEDWARSLERHNILGRYGVQVLHFVPSFVAGQPDEVRRIVEEAASRRAGVVTGVRVTLDGGSPLFRERR
ncbi:type IV toxin-antitoxin system AbiEi family antitoxin domain-containing protein [Catellatospora sp. NPDC049609]|uniref:type IV toxin-antitoxin system AbiEi family antitoxin domain-containing protein n=1 Tax=Catellatospora sp. NPDC049609 TaxID=3155505 RepID=UPI00343A3409